MRKAGTTPARGTWLRALAAGVIVVAAAGFIVYGASYHTTPVVVETKVEAPAPITPPPGAPQFFGVVPVAMSQAPTTKVVEIETSEPAVIEDITIGGLTRDSDGRIKRTYSGDAPKACPT